ncbi:MAG: TerB family tellurite resistance protein [Hyphomonas sp.]
MIIFGTKATRKLLDQGSFTCPQCQNETAFEKRRAKSWFHLYWIPLIPLKTFPAYVECMGCKGTFVEGVLNAATGAASDTIRAEFETASLMILARMAWADGKIEQQEVETIFSTVNKLCARDFTREEVEAEIDAAETSLDDALSVATRVGNMLNDEGKEVILEAVFRVAAADGDFAKEEHSMLLEIGAGLGLRPAYVRGLLQEFLENAAQDRGKALH